MTVREMLADAQRDLLRDNITPEETRRHLMKLTGLMGITNREYREAEMEFNGTLSQLTAGDEPVTKANIKAKTTPQYARLLEAKHVAEEITETRRSLAKCLVSLTEEMRLLT